ncbi:bile acid:sodium symporter family protein [Hyalangium minutum]|uniref:Na(+) dependent transporter,Sodium Bile acid symporter family protein n=1 Tax=Hyalangium minutum TaxID=394096 RepID=A0A085WWF7_9BACT|nr:bile acid:sodium symporter family protein [Hyalangium minutum]KFE72020.1 Na(+) dependent transporter,Sodium Bile acid symporter family protein [Hyalangium minutum]
MTAQQLVLSLVLAVMVFSVALELRVEDFRRVTQMPSSVVCGLLPQFVLLPVGTWCATLLLDLPPPIEAAMILVAACPGGSLSNFITHYGGGNTALSVSVSAVASLLALVLTPFNFGWMMAANPVTASWLRGLEIDPSDIWVSLVLILATPMTLGLLLRHRLPDAATKLQKPLGNFSLLALLAFIVLGLIRQRHLLTAEILPQLGLVVLHNAAGLGFGWLSAMAMRVPERDRRAVMIEGGMQNSGLALGIIAVQFNANLSMVIIASLWGIWHIVSGLTLAILWRRKDARSAA